MSSNETGLLRSRMTESPFGELVIVGSEDGVVAVLWPDDDRTVLSAKPQPAEAGESAVLDAAIAQLGEYFAGTRTNFDLPLAPEGTEFQLDAWNALRKIPYGETRSYAYQAGVIGRPKAVRAVGAANGRNPISIIVPCHRVVGSNGTLTGFAGGLDAKRWLLDHERRVLGIASGGEAQGSLFG